MLAKMPHSLTPDDLTAFAARTHGYVGADLSSLVRESASAAIQRWHDDDQHSPRPTLEYSDILATLPSIRPSAMREVFIETPTVRWSDIGGQEEVKQKLRECVEWPLTHHKTFKRLGVEAPKGVLLYGPPGCSKTMTAKALATESEINFIAIKGSEVGRCAEAPYAHDLSAAPQQIRWRVRAGSTGSIPQGSSSFSFYHLLRMSSRLSGHYPYSIKDEVDALGSSRSDERAHSGALTALLNEMDGVEELSGVTVVAATNRPEVLVRGAAFR